MYTDTDAHKYIMYIVTNTAIVTNTGIVTDMGIVTDNIVTDTDKSQPFH